MLIWRLYQTKDNAQLTQLSAHAADKPTAANSGKANMSAYFEQTSRTGQVVCRFGQIYCDQMYDGAGRKEQVYLLEDMLTNVELKHLVEAGDNVLQDQANLAELKEAQKNRNLSALGVELLNKCINMEGEVGNLAAMTLYLDGIVKFSRLR